MRPIALFGHRDCGEAKIEIMFSKGFKPLKHIVRHSPTGMEWGYGGSRPADTALSILTYALRSQKKAEPCYMDFKWDCVAKWSAREFHISLWEIREWYKEWVSRTTPR